MILQVVIIHHLMNETSCIFHTSSISSRIWTVECQVEVEVREVFLQSEEIIQIEYFIQSTCTIEIVHLTIGGMQRLTHMHNLCTQRSHTGTTTYPNHLALRIKDRMELSIRTAHSHLVAWLQTEDVRRSNTWTNIHKAHLWFWLKRRCCNTDGQHEAVALSRIVSHRVSTDSWRVVLALQGEQAELLPCWQIFAQRFLVNVLVIVH